jgi:hypothetical protein
MTKPLTPKDAVRFLTLHDPDLTSEQVKQRLEWLGFEVTTFTVNHFRTYFRDDMRFLERIGDAEG